MRILLYSDPHFCSISSIIRSRGEKYTTRLENEIKSLNWVEQLAETTDCSAIFCLGDFFDRNDLNAEELTALKDIKWSTKLDHYFLVGNHEMLTSDLSISSAHLFNVIPNIKVIDQVTELKWKNNSGEFKNILLLPYILESERKPFKYYIDQDTSKIVLSHNDIKGIRYGQIESKEGFDLNEIEGNCSLFINGHIHNGMYLNKKQTILNIGNLTGQNFNEDALQYKHCVAVLDLENMHLMFIENPYAFNFYKFNDENIDLDKLGNNAVITVKCPENKVDFLKETLYNCPKVIESRIISIPEVRELAEKDKVSSLTDLDHIEQFRNYIISQLGNSELVINELAEISK